MKTTQQQILCLMLLLASSNDVSAATNTTIADTPAIPPDSIHNHMDAISASLRKGLRGLFVKRPSSADHHHHGLSSMIPAATPGMDNKQKQQQQQLMISRGSSSSSSSTDIPITNSNTVVDFGVRVDLDHQKDGGDDHNNNEQHHDQKHSKDDKNKRQESSSENIKGRKFKVCMTHNNCYKKKLVCPKKCGKKSSSPSTPSRLLVPNHFPNHNNHCVLNCNKCVAHC